VTLDLVLIGFGNVARRFVRLLAELGPRLTYDHDIQTRVVGIATRRLGCVFDANGLDAVGRADFVESGSPLGPAARSTIGFLRASLERMSASARGGRLVVVETTTLDIVGGRPAVDHVRAALAGGAHVVTANKGPAAFAYRGLAAAASRANRLFLFESAVMDGVPIFNLQRAALPAATITGFEGVVNSTTNYILTAVEQGETFEGALAAMQRAGIAEADASLDLDGWDAAAKTAALANVLFDAGLTPHEIEREPVTAAAGPRILAARAVGRRLKLVASAERTGGAVRGRVRLAELPEANLLAQLEGQQNALVLHTDVLGDIAIVQRGSGLTQTAYGLVSDLVTIGREVRRSRTRAIPRPRPQARRGRTQATRDRR
jgi:homoserine dehydrogenase